MTNTQAKTKDISPRAAFLSVTVLVILTIGTITGVMKIMNPGTASNTASLRPHTKQTDESIQESDASDTHDYSVISERNLFHSTGHVPAALPSPPSLPVSPVIKVPPVVIQTGKPVVMPPPGPRFAYTGMVDLPTGTYVLLEELDSKRSQYVRVGDMAFGCKVISATENTVTLDQHGEQITLNYGANKIEDLGTPTAKPEASALNQPNATTPDNKQSTDAPANVNPNGIPSWGAPGSNRRFRGRTM
ncbi:MAG TPA: hypothetical protein VHV83_07925 [Armatimonadota bacterium]|nr:hypothetical protein [Armatimonadota bacterium]